MTSQDVRLGHAWVEVDDRVGAQPRELLAVSQVHGVIPRSEISDTPPRADDFSKYKTCAEGDLVLNRFNAYRGALGIAPTDGMVSPDYLVVRPRQGHSSRYLEYLLRSHYACSEMTKYMGGIGGNDPDSSGFSRIDVRALNRMRVPRRNESEQTAIADYLDHETAQVDTLIDEQQRLIDLLRERRASVLASVFAPGSHTRPTRVGYLLTHRPTYGVLVPQYVEEDDGVPLVRVGDLLSLGTEKPILSISADQSTEFSRTRIQGGEILLGVVGKMGQAVVAPAWLAGANVARAVAVLRCADPASTPLLCAWFASDHFLHQANLATSGDSIQPTLGMKDLGQFVVHWPTDVSVDYVDEQTAKIDTLIAETEHFIELSRKRRAALITATMTGQIDVRGDAV